MHLRDPRIDFLRFLGLCLVILAHVQAPFTLMQIRCFDVPLLVFVSGLTASEKIISSYWRYVCRRTMRLIVPVWLFLILYLSSFYLFQDLFFSEQYLSARMIVRSFLLLDDSIGYVWIIRVFLLEMLITPPLVGFSRKIRSDVGFLSFVLFLLLINQVVYQCSELFSDGFLKNAFVDLVVYGIAYSVPFAVGVRIKSANSKVGFLYAGTLLLMFIVLCYTCASVGNNPIGISLGYKYPPRPYYIVYGTFVSVVLWTTRSFWERLSRNKLTSFIGQNTIWIYLWHMPFALFATVFMNNWILRYVFVFSSALFLFWIQYNIIRKLNISYLNKYLLG